MEINWEMENQKCLSESTAILKAPHQSGRNIYCIEVYIYYMQGCNSSTMSKIVSLVRKS